MPLVKRSLACCGLVLAILTANPIISTAEQPISGTEAMALEERRMQAFYELEYAVRELMWHQSMSILAAYGGYNSYEVPGKKTNADDLMRLKNRIGLGQERVGAFKRYLRRDASLPSEDSERAENVITLYREFLAAADVVASHLSEGDPTSANIAYRDASVPVSKQIGSDLFTLRRKSQDRFKEHAR